MIYDIEKQNIRRNKIRRIISHPYFGFFALGIIMLIVQLLNFAGLVGISTVRSFGQTMIYIIVGLGFSILLGYSGLASLGTAGFVGLGTYVVGYFAGNLGLPFTLTIVIAIMGAILVGAIVGFISLRIEGMYLAIITLGLSEILVEVFKNATEITNGTNGKQYDFKLFSIGMDRGVAFIMIIAYMIVTMILTLNIMKSPTGRAMSAMKNSESAAQAMGIGLLKYRLLAFIISTVYAVFAGTLYMSYQEFSIPSSWGLALSLNILAAVIVGGARSIFGVVLGTFMIFGLDMVVLKKIPLFINNPALSMVFNGVLIIVVVMFYPGGLARLFSLIKFKLSQSFKKIKLKRREYRYGKDDEDGFSQS